MSASRAVAADEQVASRSLAGRRARIIAVNRFYWPDQAATSQILADLATFLAARGWPVSVVTSRTRYDNTRARLASRETKDGVRIRRVWTTRVGARSLSGRALDYATFYLSAGVALLAQARRGDVILVTTDPPLFTVIAGALARVKGARLVTWNHDIFPEVPAALGIFWAEGPLGRLLGWLRDWSLRGAATNVALSIAMADFLAQRNIGSARIRVVPNWSDARIRPVAPEENRLRREWALDAAFVIGYSGNLGRAHMPEKVAELVLRTRDLPELAWLFIGGGAGMERIHALVEETGAANVQVRPYQRREDLALSLSLPDLHLVSLDPSCEGLIVPSKVAGILAAGRPVLYLGSPRSTLGREILDSGFGVCLDAAAPGSWRDTVAAHQADPERRREMGRQARARSKELCPRRMLLSWKAVLVEAADTPRAAFG